jgi:hypothetical protein
MFFEQAVSSILSTMNSRNIFFIVGLLNLVFYYIDESSSIKVLIAIKNKKTSGEILIKGS